MRLRRLDLLRYGRFTDATLQFPRRELDLHIVYGPNEAGKSTALAALEDLLFGIPGRSPHNFLHAYASMRIGAVLEEGSEQLEVLRRKGQRSTLLDADGAPLAEGERALGPFLGTADRDFFKRMFSLDHERLRQGGRQILEEGDEAGQALFAAGAGIQELRRRLDGIREESGSLWKYRSRGRLFDQAMDRRKNAERELREQAVSARDYEALRREFQQSKEAFERSSAEVGAKETERSRLSRIRRTLLSVRDLERLDAEARELGELPNLPANARGRLDEALQNRRQAERALGDRRTELEQAQSERNALEWDDSLLLRADDVERLREQRIQVRSARFDLPKRQAEFTQLEAELRRLAREVAWPEGDVDSLAARVPPRSALATVRALLHRREGLKAALAAARTAVAEAEAEAAGLRRQLDSLGEAPPFQELADLVAVLEREQGDIASRIHAADRAAEEANAAVSEHLAALAPPLAAAEADWARPAPSRDSVLRHRDGCRKLAEKREACAAQRRAAEKALARLERDRRRLLSAGELVLKGALARVREIRDEGWALIRERHLEGKPVAEERLRSFASGHENLAAAYEAAVAAADHAADRRFETAETAVRGEQLEREIADTREELQALEQERDTLERESGELAAAWNELWARAAVQPADPDAMLVWLDGRRDLIASAQRRDSAGREADALRRRQAAAAERLARELAKVAVSGDLDPDRPLQVQLETARTLVQDLRQRAEFRLDLVERCRNAQDASARKAAALQRTLQEEAVWAEEWKQALAMLGLKADAPGAAIGEQIQTIDEIREKANAARTLRTERIEKIEQNIALFERDARETVQVLGADLAEQPVDEAVVELERRLENAKRLQEDQRRRDSQIESLQRKIQGLEAERREAVETMDGLLRNAEAPDEGALREAIARSERLLEIKEQREEALLILRQQGDGLSVQEIRADCQSFEPDQAAAHERELEEAIQAAQKTRLEIRERLWEAQQRFEAVGGRDAAAIAEADRQAALAEIREIAERYVRARTCELLLQWLIARDRRERQAPLLERASRHFARMTGESFRALELDFDESDRVRLVGLRPAGDRLPVAALSDGTADQLYCAVRVAAVEEYLAQAQALPFVADDLFINFDDERAAEAFRILGELAHRCQVIFFTHHQRLVEIAERAFAAPPPVLRLPR